ncbi:MAG: 16S rRNA (uracil(1498)-N(3))-methyltransferase [Thiotrichaceae bacterium]|nr:16S rRNA (uracil(1498)-N(3))-methyltransferase [Thiotrichaceae bacterium]
MPRIFTTTSLATHAEITLEGNAATHVGRVLRLKAGDKITLFNGLGGEYSATLIAIERQIVRAQIGTFTTREAESPLQITLAQGISRGERMDYTLQKSVELGVHRIIPLTTERCGVKLDEKRAAKRLQHWQGVIISACEQCGRNRIPEILPITPLARWLGENHTKTQPFVLHHRATHSLRQLPPPSGPISLLIGPEGGLSDSEIKRASQSGFKGIQLGPRILRTETAGIAALAALQTHWGDLG